MAEYVLSLVVERVGELLINEARSCFTYRMHGQLVELQTELTLMRSFLKEVDGRQEESDIVNNFVIEIRQVASDAEDVLEDFAFKLRRRRGLRNVLLRFVCIFKEVIAVRTVGSEIDRIKIKISNLTGSLQKYGIRAVTGGGEGPSSSQEGLLNQVRRSYSHVIEEDFVGFDEDVNLLVDKLVNRYTDRRAVSITGMGGLGKTTLAKKVYHHPDIRRHFDRFAWVCISQNWQKMDVLKGILIKLIPERTRQRQIKGMTDAELVKLLYEIQQQNKCLVVLDDIWSHDVCDTLRPAFPDRDTGSGILLTTRKEGVVFHIDQYAFQHRLRFLNGEESWQLLVKKAFPGSRGTEPRVETQMEKKGREMLQRFGGLPLAIVVLGGLLANRHALSEWERMHNKLDRNLRRGEGIDLLDRVQQVLALSYNDLPYQLKSCFLYMGNFQEDYNVCTEKLCLLWIAEGLVVPEDIEGDEIMMDVAERYLGELKLRSMVQVDSSNEEWRRGIWEPWETFRLHDLMRKLCQSKRKGEDFQSHGNVHDSSISSTGNNTKRRKLAIYFGLPIDIPDLEEFKLLRVLDFEGFEFGQKRVPEGIGKLIHLKFLSFRNCWDLNKLPSSIGNLQFLQTLDIRGCIDCFIPNILWKLERLRHLYLPADGKRQNEKLTLNGLSSLEILENLCTHNCAMKDLFSLLQLRNLKGNVNVECMDDLEIIISYLNRTSHQLRQSFLRIILHFRIEEEELFLGSGIVSTFCRLVNLVLSRQIYFLSEYRHDHFCTSLNSHDHFCTILTSHDHFCTSLTSICLLTSGLTDDPMTALEKLPNLKGLRLDQVYNGKAMVCSAGGFLQLGSLELVCLNKLENWRVDEGALPALSFLCIERCTEMKTLPEGLKFLTNLQELRIVGMPMAFSDKVRGEDSYIIRHVASVTINY